MEKYIHSLVLCTAILLLFLAGDGKAQSQVIMVWRIKPQCNPSLFDRKLPHGTSIYGTKEAIRDALLNGLLKDPRCSNDAFKIEDRIKYAQELVDQCLQEVVVLPESMLNLMPNSIRVRFDEPNDFIEYYRMAKQKSGCNPVIEGCIATNGEISVSVECDQEFDLQISTSGEISLTIKGTEYDASINLNDTY